MVSFFEIDHFGTWRSVKCFVNGNSIENSNQSYFCSLDPWKKKIEQNIE